jgi:hypothetical protein
MSSSLLFFYQPKALGGFSDGPHGSNRPIADESGRGENNQKRTLAVSDP